MWTIFGVSYLKEEPAKIVQKNLEKNCKIEPMIHQIIRQFAPLSLVLRWYNPHRESAKWFRTNAIILLKESPDANPQFTSPRHYCSRGKQVRRCYDRILENSVGEFTAAVLLHETRDKIDGGRLFSEFRCCQVPKYGLLPCAKRRCSFFRKKNRSNLVKIYQQ